MPAPGDDSGDAIYIRDIVVPPLSRSSSQSCLVRRRSMCNLFADNLDEDRVIAVIKTPKDDKKKDKKKNKKKKKKKKDGGLLGWLSCGGEDCILTPIKRVSEPQQVVVQRQPSISAFNANAMVDVHGGAAQIRICIICNTYHHASCFSAFNGGCCMCTGHGHNHILCQYQHHYRHRHRSRHRHSHHHHHHDHHHQAGCGCWRCEYDCSSEVECNHRRSHRHSHWNRGLENDASHGMCPGGLITL